MKIIRFEALNERYIKEIAALEKECFTPAWSESSIAEEMSSPNTALFAALDEENGGVLMGYVGLHFVLDEGYMDNLAVTEAYRRCGVATELLKTLDAFAMQKGLSFITLEVRESNMSAIALYDKNGYSPVGKRKGFYSSPLEDAILMTKNY